MKVGITGITGYLGSAVGKAFLNKGKYFVRGSVRSLDNQKKIDPIKKAYEGNESNYELVEADLSNKDSLFEFVKGLDYVVHVASPFPNLTKKVKEEDVITPAVEGTLNILKAAHEYNVKRVVCTSSVASIADTQGFKLMYDHDDQPDPDGVDSIYSKSKIITEIKSWEYINGLRDAGKSLEMVTIHPAGIIGPTLTQDTDFTSMDFISGLVTGKFPMLPKVAFAFTDVRDCAEMHINALTAPAGRRYIVCSDSYFFDEIAQMIKEEFGGKGFNPTTRVMPFFVARILQYFNPFIKNNMNKWGKRIRFDSSFAIEHLKYEPTPVRQSLKDMIDSAIEKGYIKQK